MAEKIGEGVEYSQVSSGKLNGKLHVVRVVRDLAEPFVIGPVINTVYPSGGGDRVRLSSLSQVLNTVTPIYPTIKGKKQTLVPLWVSNGVFFGEDQDKYEDKVKYFVAGPLLQNAPKARRANAPKDLGSKLNRWLYLQNLYASKNVEARFAQMQGYASAYNIRTGKVPYLPVNAYKSRRWQWAIGGAASLVENGKVHTESYWGSPGGGKFSADQWYSTGPIIARNADNPPILYLLLEASNSEPGGNPLPWREMASYLTTDFLKDIGHPGDGNIDSALVYDGGTARQVWVRGKGKLFDYGRPVPQHICLWGRE